MSIDMSDGTEVLTREKEVVGDSSLFVVGVGLDARVAIPLTDQENLPSLVAITPFVFVPPENGEQPTLLPLPIRGTGLAEEKVEEINQVYDPLLREQFVAAFRVEEESLGFNHVEDGAVEARVRHEIGYHLLKESEKDDPEIPNSVREAFRNTGMMFLLSVGIDRLLSREEKPSMFSLYKERFEHSLGPLRFQTLRGTLKRDKGVEFVDEQLKFMGQTKYSYREVEGLHDIRDLGEGYVYVLSQLVKRGVTVEVITETEDLYPNEQFGSPFKTAVLALS